MKRLLGLCLAIGLMASAAEAAPPDLKLPETVSGQPGQFISIAATTSGKVVSWLVLDDGLNLFPVALLKDTKTAVVCGSKPGNYRILAVTAAADEVSTPVICTVQIQGPTPPPAPRPAPTPGPTPPPAPPAPPVPAPTAKTAWAIVVIDNTRRTPAQGQLLTSASLIQTITQQGITLRTLDVTDPLVQQKNYGPAVTAAGGPPALITFSADGQRLKAIPLPADEASFAAAVGASLSTAPVCGPGGCPNCPR